MKLKNGDGALRFARAVSAAVNFTDSENGFAEFKEIHHFNALYTQFLDFATCSQTIRYFDKNATYLYMSQLITTLLSLLSGRGLACPIKASTKYVGSGKLR